MTIRRNVYAVTGGAVLAAGLAAAAAIALPGAANADPCAAGAACTTQATVDLTPGVLTMAAPDALGWSADLIGAPQTIYDTTAGDDSFGVSDLTGTDAGWSVTATATTFTSTTTPTETIPDAGQLLTFGGGSNSTDAATAPLSACVTSGDCTVPDDAGVTGYPLAVPTGSVTPTTIYAAAADTGMGAIQIGSGANLSVWAVNLPAIFPADSYVSTITLSVTAGP